jgi:hypothetical protein
MARNRVPCDACLANSPDWFRGKDDPVERNVYCRIGGKQKAPVVFVRGAISMKTYAPQSTAHSRKIRRIPHY